MLDPKLMEILACPKCKSALQEKETTLLCQNAQCRLEYPIKEGIPVLLIAEAAKS